MRGPGPAGRLPTERPVAPALPPLGSHFRSFTLVVLDGVGIGPPPGGSAGLDRGADTLGHVAGVAGTLAIANLGALGLDLLKPEACPATGARPGRRRGTALRMVPVSPGKDSLTGHWELAGLVTGLDLKTFPEGFPDEMMDQLALAFGRRPLGGMPASGTEIIERLGPEHLRTGRPIVYTSADSVLQIAAHEDIVPRDDLYRMCLAARSVAAGPWLVGRVIARPFAGRPGGFARTAGRRDFSLPPPGHTVLEAAREAGVEVISVGKVWDVFSGRGITRRVEAHGNDEAISALLALAREETGASRRLVFANLNDFDSKYGHRRDAPGFAQGLEDFDRRLPELVPDRRRAEILAVTADHGCDPTHPGTDHTREAIPLLLAGTGWPPGCLGTVNGLTAAAGLISAAFGLKGFELWPRKQRAGGITHAVRR